MAQDLRPLGHDVACAGISFILKTKWLRRSRDKISWNLEITLEIDFSFIDVSFTDLFISSACGSSHRERAESRQGS
jgi:hypothetical protein